MQKIRKNVINIVILQTVIFLLFRFNIGINSRVFSPFNCNKLISQINRQIGTKNDINTLSDAPVILTVGTVTGEAIAGFTLAEVLITLLIIGIVSSIVIPGLIQDTQEMEYKQAFRKVYSDIAQAAMQYKQDNGGIIPVDGTVGTWYPTFRNIMPYFKVQKICSSNCFSINSTPAFNYKSLSGSNESPNHFDDGQRILVNGVFLSSEYPISLIWVDVNGFVKGPNVIGKDVFGIVVTPTGITPAGSSASGISSDTCSKTYTGTYYGGSKTSSAAGWGCAALVIQGKDY